MHCVFICVYMSLDVVTTYRSSNVTDKSDTHSIFTWTRNKRDTFTRRKVVRKNKTIIRSCKALFSCCFFYETTALFISGSLPRNFDLISLRYVDFHSSTWFSFGFFFFYLTLSISCICSRVHVYGLCIRFRTNKLAQHCMHEVQHACMNEHAPNEQCIFTSQ